MSSVNIAQPDVTLLLDLEGVIREATISAAVSQEGVEGWLGRPWGETVGDVGGEKVRRMLDDARAGGVSAFRQVNQRLPSGVEIPIEYTTVLLGGRAGLLAIGKSLQAVADLQSRFVAAQQTMERDYWKLREVETRYRLLFQATGEAILVLHADTLMIADANPAAHKALGIDAEQLQAAGGRNVLTYLQPQERESFQLMLARVREQGKAPASVLRLGGDRKPWTVRASLTTSSPDALFLLHLSPLGLPESNRAEGDAVSIEELVERMPDGFVLIDQDGIVRRTNHAFLGMIQVGANRSVLGERLARWLWRPGADLTVLLANVRQHGSIRLFTTTLHGELGSDTEVEISAAGIAGTQQQYVGVIFRDVGRRIDTSDSDRGLRHELGAIAEKIGKVPLRTLVKDAVGVVERQYIREALDLANGNRTVTAELLGLSRQSLYAKLNRYNIDGGTEADATD